PAGSSNEFGEIKFSGLLRQQLHSGLAVSMFQDPKGGFHAGVPRPMSRRLVVEHDPASNRRDRRKLPDDEAVAGEIKARVGQPELGISALPGLELLQFEQDDFRQSFRRPAVEVDSGTVLQGTRGREKRQRAIEAGSSLKEVRGREDHASCEFAGLDPYQV